MRVIPSLQSVHKVVELNYVNVDNTPRYRAIMRFLYQEYQRLNYWLKPEEVYEGISRWGLFEGYTLEECKIDLERLVEWKNLTSRHDGGRAVSVDDYLRKKFQYLLTPYSIEIERLLEELESVRGYGGSLEPTLFEVIDKQLSKIRSQATNYESGQALSLWNELFESFRSLHQTSVDYIASLHAAKAEELMHTKTFLIYKETLEDYLKKFVKALQRKGYRIEGKINSITVTMRDFFIEAVIEDVLHKPRLEEVSSREELLGEFLEEWDHLKRWFTGYGGSPSELSLLEQASKEAIVRIVRCALRIQERRNSGISRKKELDHLGRWFYYTNEIENAHRLAAVTFGLFKTRHLQGEDLRETDRSDISMWQEKPMVRPLRSRSTKRVGRQDSESIPDNTKKRKEVRAKVLEEQREILCWLQEVVKRGSIRICEMGSVSSKIKVQLLQWIGQCTWSKSNSCKIFIPEGIMMDIYRPDANEIAILNCADGQLQMPNYRFVFIVANEALEEAAAEQEV